MPRTGKRLGPPSWLTAATAAVVIVTLALAWLLLVALDLRENDGIAPLIAMVGLPMLASAVIIQLVADNTHPKHRMDHAVLWWSCAVLPGGIVAGFAVAVAREPDYFLGDGPWMLVWIPIFVIIGLLLGSLVWFFFVFPLVNLVRIVRLIVRGEAKPGMVIMPLVLIALGVLCLVGGLSVDTDASGRLAWGAIIASILGVPGAYEVVWEPGLWIVRGIIVAITLVFAIPAVRNRFDRSGLRGEAVRSRE